MLKVFVTIFAALMLIGCSSSTSGDIDAERSASRSYFHFTVVGGLPTSTEIYYCVPLSASGGHCEMYRVIEPIVDIDSYDEIVIGGTGPHGSGEFLTRIVLDEKDIKRYTDTYFIIRGL